jgi:hypothetical protein
LAEVQTTITALDQTAEALTRPWPAQVPAHAGREAVAAPAGPGPNPAEPMVADVTPPAVSLLPEPATPVPVISDPTANGEPAPKVDIRPDPDGPVPAAPKSRWLWPVLVLATVLGGALLTAALKLAGH